MAFKPSLRAHNRVKEIPLDIRPVMNLMVVLIPVLLYSSEFVKLSIRELNLPPASSFDQSAAEEKPQEEEKRMQLTVILSQKGFYIGNKSGYLTGESNMAGEPAIPIEDDGNYDFVELQRKLIEFKDKIKNHGFVDELSVIISAEADIEYKYIIKTIDFVTIYVDSLGNEQELFPQINIGQVI